ncbi:hypothetical protein A2642_02965 [Candidatus Nomurabacteria bacterium RIFCSPHIGHO2_01_FULL_39_10]|uniref:Uncharacterized protein n=1 Tax=Candidatus Nomurabacteria bacterium RIFCSPHIGHO2_01_FULL_39_10 TaxID=1801733 RepID=A0A1F6V531_9BACT|nr:MAG: hypothetical protein A2642_02965 [Candidatus Nomurabacteria bacterium RIFCSPHIGHO2_01_FULL_39_10]
MQAETVTITEYIQKINKVEAMLEEIKQGLTLFQTELQESIQRGEKDITEGRVTICKTEVELDKFFAQI